MSHTPANREPKVPPSATPGRVDDKPLVVYGTNIKPQSQPQPKAPVTSPSDCYGQLTPPSSGSGLKAPFNTPQSPESFLKTPSSSSGSPYTNIMDTPKTGTPSPTPTEDGRDMDQASNQGQGETRASGQVGSDSTPEFQPGVEMCGIKNTFGSGSGSGLQFHAQIAVDIGGLKIGQDPAPQAPGEYQARDNVPSYGMKPTHTSQHHGEHQTAAHPGGYNIGSTSAVNRQEDIPAAGVTGEGGMGPVPAFQPKGNDQANDCIGGHRMSAAAPPFKPSGDAWPNFNSGGRGMGSGNPAQFQAEAQAASYISRMGLGPVHAPQMPGEIPAASYGSESGTGSAHPYQSQTTARTVDHIGMPSFKGLPYPLNINAADMSTAKDYDKLMRNINFDPERYLDLAKSWVVKYQDVQPIPEHETAHLSMKEKACAMNMYHTALAQDCFEDYMPKGSATHRQSTHSHAYGTNPARDSTFTAELSARAPKPAATYSTKPTFNPESVRGPRQKQHEAKIQQDIADKAARFERIQQGLKNMGADKSPFVPKTLEELKAHDRKFAQWEGKEKTRKLSRELHSKEETLKAATSIVQWMDTFPDPHTCGTGCFDDGNQTAGESSSQATKPEVNTDAKSEASDDEAEK